MKPRSRRRSAFSFLHLICAEQIPEQWNQRNGEASWSCSPNVLALLPAFRYPRVHQRGSMVQRVSTVAFEGIEARAVDVQVQVAPGLPAFAIVGLPDKGVPGARGGVRSPLPPGGVPRPPRRITVNLAPADLPKEGSHY